jgi:hypothetical protein
MKDEIQIIVNELESRLKWYSDELDELGEKLKENDCDEDDHDLLESYESVYYEIKYFIEFINNINQSKSILSAK